MLSLNTLLLAALAASLSLLGGPAAQADALDDVMNPRC
jgi:hypothetical protein